MAAGYTKMILSLAKRFLESVKNLFGSLVNTVQGVNDEDETSVLHFEANQEISSMISEPEEEPEAKFDIISALIDRNLDSIARDIFARLDENDLSCAIAAQPKWAQALNSTHFVKNYFADETSNLYLKVLYAARIRKRLQLMIEEPAYSRTLFEEALHDYSHPRANANRQNNGAFTVQFPLECKNWMFDEVQMSRNFIVIVLYQAKIGLDYRKKKDRRKSLVFVYNRWTLAIVNSISFMGFLKNLFLPDHEGPWITLTIKGFDDRDVKTLAWNVANGEKYPFHHRHNGTMGFSNLLIFNSYEKHGFGKCSSAYRLNAKGAFDSLILEESLDSRMAIRYSIPASAGAEIIGLVGNVDNFPDTLEIRSTRDFSLVRSTPWKSELHTVKHYRSFLLLSDSLLVAINERHHVIEVLYIHPDGSETKVHKFVAKSAKKEFFNRSTTITVNNNYLVAWSNYSAIVIWELPSNFHELCQRHLEARNVGQTLEYRVITESGPSKTGYIQRRRVFTDDLGIVRFEYHGKTKPEMTVRPVFCLP